VVFVECVEYRLYIQLGKNAHCWSLNCFLESTFRDVMDFMKEIEDLVVKIMDHNKGNDDSI